MQEGWGRSMQAWGAVLVLQGRLCSFVQTKFLTNSQLKRLWGFCFLSAVPVDTHSSIRQLPSARGCLFPAKRQAQLT